MQNPTAKNKETFATCHSMPFIKYVFYPKETMAWYLSPYTVIRGHSEKVDIFSLKRGTNMSEFQYGKNS